MLVLVVVVCRLLRLVELDQLLMMIALDDFVSPSSGERLSGGSSKGQVLDKFMTILVVLLGSASGFDGFSLGDQ